MKNIKASILIVEDDLMLAEALKEKFTREKFQVFMAKNGQEGVDRALKKQPDIILLDIIMPVMDGIEALKQLRADKDTKKIPVIMLTNLSDADQLEAARKQGVTDYLVKADSSMEAVVKRVKDKLKK